MNQNLDFVPAPKDYNKNELNLDIQEFFCLIKLKAHFKENNKPTASSEYNRAFQIKNKQKWTPKETGHTIDILFNFIETHINNVKTRIPKPNLTKKDKIAKESESTSFTSHRGYTQRKQSTKTCYGFHQLLHF